MPWEPAQRPVSNRVVRFVSWRGVGWLHAGCTEDGLKSKRLYLLAIFYIAIIVILFNWIYPEVPVTSLSLVIALLGFILALGSNFAINRIKNQREKKNDH